MAKLGNKNRVYMTSAAISALTGVTGADVLVGETTNSLSINGNLIEVSDKTTAWQQFIAGVKGGSLSVTVNAEDGDAKQKSLLSGLTGGSLVHCFVGDPTVGGYAFDAYVGSISMSNDNAAVASWTIELTASGEIKHLEA